MQKTNKEHNNNNNNNNNNNFIIIHISVDLNWASGNEEQTIQNQNSCKKLQSFLRTFLGPHLIFKDYPPGM